MKKVKRRAESWRWALPPKVTVPPDELRARVDIYGETVALKLYDNGVVTTRPVSALDIARAFCAEIRLSSGLLPEGALWWASGREGQEVALWLPPRVWPAALQAEAFQPPRRFRLPMPGLVFVCQTGRPPRVFAAKSRPTGPKAQLYHAPLFNVFRDGRTCAGTQQYSRDVSKHPQEFFTAFFTRAADIKGRSKRHPEDLLALWEELDGKRRFLLGDLVPCCKMQDVAPTGGTS